ncbi:MAG: hypothetical protein MI810_16670 [Flavobacteriales bacterium]|nr:hypothetical protein [Flavobacteriales bacterium]
MANNGPVLKHQAVFTSSHSQKIPSSLLAEELMDEEEDNNDEESKRIFNNLSARLASFYSTVSINLKSDKSLYTFHEKSITQEPPYILFCSLKIPS